jgi:pilus assembly protein TadC
VLPLLIAALLACAVWLLMPDDRHSQVRLSGLASPGAPSIDVRNARSGWLSPRRAAVIAGAATAVLWGGWTGVALGLGIIVVVPMLLARLEPGDVRRRRNDLARQAPMVADLLAATIASGALPRDCVAAIAHSIGNPAASVLHEVRAGLDLGADPRVAWAPLVREAALAPLGRSIIRSSESGAPLVDVLSAAAQDQRRLLRTRAQSAARTAGVHAVAPLALCFLPAFIVVGIVPVVASLAVGLWSGQ